MSLKIQTTPTHLHLAERGLLDYINRHLDGKGLFCETLHSLSEHLAISPSYAHKIQKRLVDWGYVAVVEAPRRNRSGRYETSAVLRTTGKSPDTPPFHGGETAHATKSGTVKTQKSETEHVIENTVTMPFHSHKDSQDDFRRSMQQRVNANTVHITHSAESRAVGGSAHSTSVCVVSETAKPAVQANCVICAMLNKVGTPVAYRGTNGYCQKHNQEMFWLGKEE